MPRHGVRGWFAVRLYAPVSELTSRARSNVSYQAGHGQGAVNVEEHQNFGVLHIVAMGGHVVSR